MRGGCIFPWDRPKNQRVNRKLINRKFIYHQFLHPSAQGQCRNSNNSSSKNSNNNSSSNSASPLGDMLRRVMLLQVMLRKVMLRQVTLRRVTLRRVTLRQVTLRRVMLRQCRRAYMVLSLQSLHHNNMYGPKPTPPRIRHRNMCIRRIWRVGGWMHHHRNRRFRGSFGGYLVAYPAGLSGVFSKHGEYKITVLHCLGCVLDWAVICFYVLWISCMLSSQSWKVDRSVLCRI